MRSAGQRARLSGMDRYSAANKALWEEWTEIHVRSAFYDVEGWKAGRGLPELLLEEVGDVAGKDLLHLQCHFGLDTLSWARLGARVTGVDFSERAVAHARALAAEARLEATFVQADVLDLPAALGGDFDVVFTSFGVLGWLPDLARWGRVAARYVRPGGFLYVAEGHPFALGFDEDDPSELRLRWPYFTTAEPLAFPVQGSYADPDADVQASTEYGWQHSLGEVVTALAAAGLRVEWLHEHAYAAWKMFPFCVEARWGGRRWWRLPGELHGRLPLTFSLKASRPASG
jgi:SAM-dependent methyltransferase